MTTRSLASVASLLFMAACASTGAAGAPSVPAAAPPAPAGPVDPAVGEVAVASSLQDLIAADRRTVLVFMTRWCKVCQREQPAVERWARSHRGDTRTVVVVSGSPAADVQHLVSERRLDTAVLTVVADPDGSLADQLGVQATPALLMFPPGVATPTGRVRRVEELPDVPAAPVEPVSDTGVELGTSYDVLVLARGRDGHTVRADLEAARALVRSLGAQLSEWSPDSEVSQLNGRAAAAPVTLSPTLRRLIAGALHVSAMTGGAFDVTWPPLGRLWDEAARTGHPPDDAAFAAALRSVGARNLLLEGDTLRFGDPGTRIGVGGVAKGAIVDAAFLLLRERGYADIVVNIGGDLRTCGQDESGAPRVFQLVNPYAADGPRRSGELAGTIEVEDTAIATSGNYRRFWDVGGQRVGHILDPRTGRPPAFDGSVTVLTRDAAMADALATALYVMGPDEGLAFSRSVAGLDAIYVTRDGVKATVPVESAH